jgi:hypothetical protein
MINKSPRKWDNTMVLSTSRGLFYGWIPAFAGMTWFSLMDYLGLLYDFDAGIGWL